ncbi:MAG: hypothetical protein AAF628_15225 [Planctomycetota bacterium]
MREITQNEHGTDDSRHADGTLAITWSHTRRWRRQRRAADAAEGLLLFEVTSPNAPRSGASSIEESLYRGFRYRL